MFLPRDTPCAFAVFASLLTTPKIAVGKRHSNVNRLMKCGPEPAPANVCSAFFRAFPTTARARYGM